MFYLSPFFLSLFLLTNIQDDGLKKKASGSLFIPPKLGELSFFLCSQFQIAPKPIE